MSKHAPTVTPPSRHGAASDAALPPLQREFARLARQVEQAQRQLQAWRDAPDALDARVATELAPAFVGLRDAEHSLVVQLDALLVSPPKGLRLGAARREALSAYLLDLCRGLLAHARDDTLIAIHDRHSRHSLAELAEDERAEALEQALAMLDAVFGAGCVRPQPGESDEDFYARAQHRLTEAYHAERKREDTERARRAERRAGRKAARDAAKARSRQDVGDGAGDKPSSKPDSKRGTGRSARGEPPAGGGPRGTTPASDDLFGHPSINHPTPASALSGGPEASPEDRLRGLYRRLASALHPDRAPDGDARAMRTQQMKRLNAAWEARDLLALLSLQAESRQGDSAPDDLPDDQARDWVTLLKAQLQSLKADARHAADAATPPDIAITRGRPRDPGELMQWLELDLQRIRRNARILRGIAAGLADPGQRKEVLTELVDIAEAELARRAVDQFLDELHL